MRMCFAVGALVAGLSSTAMGNVLANPGFEAGLSGWSAFGNAFAETTNPPAIQPLSGSGVAKLFGNFSGGFNVTGIFQEFATTPGTSWTMDSYSRHFSGDAMVGVGLPNDNWAVMKIAFFDAGNAEIGAAERVILDGTFATDVWHDNLSITGIAPAGTVKLQAFLLYLQPAFAGGAAQFDDVSLIPTPGSAAALGLAGVAALRRRRR
jgi:uncharacterized protein (TIGR03382 family)